MRRKWQLTWDAFVFLALACVALALSLREVQHSGEPLEKVSLTPSLREWMAWGQDAWGRPEIKSQNANESQLIDLGCLNSSVEAQHLIQVRSAAIRLRGRVCNGSDDVEFVVRNLAGSQRDLTSMSSQGGRGHGKLFLSTQGHSFITSEVRLLHGKNPIEIKWYQVRSPLTGARAIAWILRR